MTATRLRKPSLKVIVDDVSLPHTVLIAAPVRIISPRLREFNIPSQYDGLRHAFKVPKAHPRVSDLLVALEQLDGHRIEMVAGWSR